MDHGHPGFHPEDDDHGADDQLINHLVGAAYDSCGPCQARDIDQIITTSATTARLVELACMLTQQVLGGLPPGMTDPDAPGPSSPPFRALARASANGHHDSMYQLVTTMDNGARRQAIDTALDQIIGLLLLQPYTHPTLDPPPTRSAPL